MIKSQHMPGSWFQAMSYMKSGWVISLKQVIALKLAKIMSAPLWYRRVAEITVSSGNLMMVRYNIIAGKPCKRGDNMRGGPCQLEKYQWKMWTWPTNVSNEKWLKI